MSDIPKGYFTEGVHKFQDQNAAWIDTGSKDFLLCNVKVQDNGSKIYICKGQMKPPLSALGRIQDIYVQYWAPNKRPVNYSYCANFLPWENEVIAYQDTPNSGAVKVIDGKFQFSVESPNGYYTDMGVKLQPPQMKFRFVDRHGSKISKIYTVKIPGQEMYDKSLSRANAYRNLINNENIVYGDSYNLGVCT